VAFAEVARRLSLRFSLADFDPADDALRFPPPKIDRQQTVLHVRATDLNTLGQDKRPSELASGYAAIKILASFIFLLLAVDRQPAVLYGNFQLVARETSDRQRYSQHLCPRVIILGNSLDIIRRIAVSPTFSCAVNQPLDFIEAEQERARQKRHA
jgi:hypothetical protein